MTESTAFTPPPLRLAIHKIAPEMHAAMSALEEASAAGLDPALRELMKTRASQMNGCAYCIDMHTKDARAAGESEQRLYALNAWRETPFFSEEERAALALTEAITDLDHERLDAAWDQAAEYFNEHELCALLMTVVAINGWNRIAISSRAPAGAYKPRRHES